MVISPEELWVTLDVAGRKGIFLVDMETAYSVLISLDPGPPNPVR